MNFVHTAVAQRCRLNDQRSFAAEDDSLLKKSDNKKKSKALPIAVGAAALAAVGIGIAAAVKKKKGE